MTVSFQIMAAAFQQANYAIGFSTDASPYADPTDKWQAGGSAGTCPQNGVNGPVEGGAPAWHPISVVVTVPAGFAGGFVIVMADEYGFTFSSTNCSYEDIETTGFTTACNSPTPTRTRTPTITPTPQLPLTKSSNVSVAAVGQTLTFCVAWTNDSSSTITRTFYDDLVPYLSYVGGQAGCSAAAQRVTCSFSAAAGASGSKCFWAVVNSAPP